MRDHSLLKHITRAIICCSGASARRIASSLRTTAIPKFALALSTRLFSVRRGECQHKPRGGQSHYRSHRIPAPFPMEPPSSGAGMIVSHAKSHQRLARQRRPLGLILPDTNTIGFVEVRAKSLANHRHSNGHERAIIINMCHTWNRVADASIIAVGSRVHVQKTSQIKSMFQITHRFLSNCAKGSTSQDPSALLLC
jgi:hypothetical protein